LCQTDSTDLTPKKTWNDVFDEVTNPEEVDLKKTDQISVTVSDRAGQTFEPDMEESGPCPYDNPMRFLFIFTGFPCIYDNPMRPSLKIFQFAQTRPMTFGYGKVGRQIFFVGVK
jgi:hypothetical protein